MASTVTRMASPGMAHSHHAVRRKVRPAPIMKPQLMTLGSPRPRKASADSMSIAVATISEPVTRMGESTLGRISRKMMRRSSMPSVTQACTNSRLRMASTSPRTSRAMGGQVTTAMAMTMLVSWGD